MAQDTVGKTGRAMAEQVRKQKMLDPGNPMRQSEYVRRQKRRDPNRRVSRPIARTRRA